MSEQERAAGVPADAPQPVAVRYRDASGRWRYLNYPFTKGWTFPASLGTLVYLCEQPASEVNATPQHYCNNTGTVNAPCAHCGQLCDAHTIPGRLCPAGVKEDGNVPG